MISDLLTIVIPTRDRVHMLASALQSVFEKQGCIPRVIVSDNSTADHPEIQELKRRYGFDYVRQSGEVPLQQHHNACLGMARTRWVWLVHDDDEVYPGAIDALVPFLARCPDVGVIAAGMEFIDAHGRTRKTCLPEVEKKLWREEAMLALGLDWGRTWFIFGAREAVDLGGYPEAAGLTGDYAFAVVMAYRHGVVFFPCPIYRHRQGHDHAADFISDPAKIDRWFLFKREQVEPIRKSGCSRIAADKIIDYLYWNALLDLAGNWLDRNPGMVVRKAHECLRHSPASGQWQDSVREQLPFVFWHPWWLAWPLFRSLQGGNELLKRITGNRSKALRNWLKSLVLRTPDSER